MDMMFRETSRKKEPIEIEMEFMLYICKGCDHSFSLPLLPEREKQAFLFPAGEKRYYFLSFAEEEDFYLQMQKKLVRYAYPYLNFDRFDRTAFLSYVEQRLWADLIDRDPGERVSSPVTEQRCPYCGSQKLKVIGRLLACQGEEADFEVRRGTLEGFLSLPEAEQNKTVILLMKEYAADCRSVRTDRQFAHGVSRKE